MMFQSIDDEEEEEERKRDFIEEEENIGGTYTEKKYWSLINSKIVEETTIAEWDTKGEIYFVNLI